MQSFVFCHLHSLQSSNCVMDLDHVDGKLRIHYSDRLSSLLREVRQLAALGFTIPAGIQRAANTADKFHRQAIVLKQVRALIEFVHSFIDSFIYLPVICHALQVAHFYNTIDQQMIPSQRPMMLGLALAFEQIIKVS